MDLEDATSDGRSNLHELVRLWNGVAEEMIATIKSLTDESTADAALPALIEKAQAYQRCYDEFWLSDIEPTARAQLHHQRVISRIELETQLRALKFRRRHVFKRIRKIMKHLRPCDIDVSPNVD